MHMSAKDCKWMKVSASERKWMHLIACEQKWMHMITSDCKWLHVIACEHIWVHLNAIELGPNRKWTGPIGHRLASNEFSMDIDVCWCQFERKYIIDFRSERYLVWHYDCIGEKVCKIGSMKRWHDSINGGDRKNEIFSDF